MKLTRMLFVGLLVASIGGTAIANASTRRPTARRAQNATVELRETSLGKILVSASGFTLFEFTKDKKLKDNCVTISGCPEVWPPLEVTGTPTAGTGVNASLLSTITLPGGAKQVTYKGHPLYMYIHDVGPGETGYVGAFEFGGHWYALNAKGRAVK
jgi:predicted lipoprotein with Yx(FWY)xxD motif